MEGFAEMNMRPNSDIMKGEKQLGIFQALIKALDNFL